MSLLAECFERRAGAPKIVRRWDGLPATKVLRIVIRHSGYPHRDSGVHLLTLAPVACASHAPRPRLQDRAVMTPADRTHPQAGTRRVIQHGVLTHQREVIATERRQADDATATGDRPKPRRSSRTSSGGAKPFEPGHREIIP